MATRVTVHGRVQGVFFRASTRDLARRVGVVGWVRNDPDGGVTAHLEGDAGAVQQVVAWCRAGGPDRARVDRISTTEVADEGHTGFHVRH